MTDQPTSEQSAEQQHRATIIAGLRAVADFLEAHPEIPEPYTIREQHSVTDEYDPRTRQMIHKSADEKVTEVRRIAAQLGVEATIYDDGRGIMCEYPVAEQALYIVHAFLASGDAS